MPARTSFDYAVLRLVPRVDREEFFNAGLILFCLGRKFLHARIHVEPELLQAFAPDLDQEAALRHLQAFVSICAGDADAGPVARLDLRQRFHWLTAPRSTVIQVSPVHCGLCVDPGEQFAELFRRLVLR